MWVVRYFSEGRRDCASDTVNKPQQTQSMKLLVITLCVTMCSLAGLQGQGTVNFSNDPVYDAPEFGGGLLAGTNFFAQVYFAAGTGAASSSLVPVGSPMPFRSGLNAGYVNFSNPFMSPIPGGGPATFQLRAWWSGDGVITSYETALTSADANSRAGASPTLDVVLESRPTPPVFVTFQSFALTVVPEPSAVTLIVCGGAAVFLLRRTNRNRTQS